MMFSFAIYLRQGNGGLLWQRGADCPDGLGKLWNVWRWMRAHCAGASRATVSRLSWAEF
ncbi:MAG: hypothetical protein IAE79_15815 [Anaerolinea sp.]|nr:hypothetical protein [Anaerolinea sp.]